LFPAIAVSLHRAVTGVAIAAATTAGCFAPDLGDNPFLCATDAPRCPDSYVCRGTVCIRPNAPAADGGGDDDDASPGATLPDPTRCPDRDVETPTANDRAAAATPVGVGRSTGWAICRSGDVDYYRLELRRAPPGMPPTKLRVLLTFQPIAGAGTLDLVFFGGAQPEAAAETAFDHPEGRELPLVTPVFSAGADAETFFLKVFARPLALGGGPNFYDLTITLR